MEVMQGETRAPQAESVKTVDTVANDGGLLQCFGVGGIAQAKSFVREPTTDSEKMKAQELSLVQLATATLPSHVWMRDCIVRWRDMPGIEDCEGERFFETAQPMTTVYPWIFQVKYAVNYLTKDFNEHLTIARKKWPEGANTLREAVRAELNSMGLAALEKAYWNTCTVRILWIYRALAIFVCVLQDLCNTSLTPVEGAQKAVDAVLAPYLNWALGKIASYIISACVYRTRDKLFDRLNMAEDEVKNHMGVLARSVRPHVQALEQMLRQEVPSVVDKKP